MIDATGMHLGRRFGNVTGILGGNPVHVSPADIERVWTHLDSDTNRRQGDQRAADIGEPRRVTERRKPT